MRYICGFKRAFKKRLPTLPMALEQNKNKEENINVSVCGHCMGMPHFYPTTHIPEIENKNATTEIVCLIIFLNFFITYQFINLFYYKG